MTITASLDMSKMLAVIRQFPGQTVTTQDDLLKEQCRLLISTSGRTQRGLVQITPPFNQGSKKPEDGTPPKNSGRGGDAKQSGINSVRYDMARIYGNPGDAWEAIKKINPGQAVAFWKAWKKKDLKTMFAIVQNVRGLPSQFVNIRKFDGGAEHKKRFKNGRLRGRGITMIVTNTSALKSYTAKKARNVGIMAAMVPYAAGSKLGGLKGVPSWVKRHKKSGGYIIPKKSRNKSSFTIGVSSRYVADMQRRMSYVLGYRMNALKRQLPYIAKRLEKKLQAQLNAT